MGSPQGERVKAPNQDFNVTCTVKTNPCFSPTPVFGMRVKQEESVIWLFMNIDLPITILIKRSRRELSIDMVIHRGIFKINQITLFPCFTFMPDKGVSFYGVRLVLMTK